MAVPVDGAVTIVGTAKTAPASGSESLRRGLIVIVPPGCTVAVSSAAVGGRLLRAASAGQLDDFLRRLAVERSEDDEFTGERTVFVGSNTTTMSQ